MQFNLPYKVRAAIYITYGIGSIVVTYLAAATQVIGAAETAAWTSLGVFVSALAGINVTPEK